MFKNLYLIFSGLLICAGPAWGAPQIGDTFTSPTKVNTLIPRNFCKLISQKSVKKWTASCTSYKSHNGYQKDDGVIENRTIDLDNFLKVNLTKTHAFGLNIGDELLLLYAPYIKNDTPEGEAFVFKPQQLKSIYQFGEFTVLYTLDGYWVDYFYLENSNIEELPTSGDILYPEVTFLKGYQQMSNIDPGGRNPIAKTTLGFWDAFYIYWKNVSELPENNIAVGNVGFSYSGSLKPEPVKVLKILSNAYGHHGIVFEMLTGPMAGDTFSEEPGFMDWRISKRTFLANIRYGDRIVNGKVEPQEVNPAAGIEIIGFSDKYSSKAPAEEYQTLVMDKNYDFYFSYTCLKIRNYDSKICAIHSEPGTYLKKL